MDLKEIRKKIDSIDKQILKLLEERFSLMPNVIEYKIKNNLKILDTEREQKILEDKISLLKDYNINKDFIVKIYKLIMDESKNIQKEYLKKNK